MSHGTAEEATVSARWRVRVRYGVLEAMLATLVAMTATLLASSASAQTPVPPPTEQQVFQQLGVDSVPADYVVLIDTSGSMAANGRYDQVRGTLRSFLDGTTSADHVAVYTFDDVVTPRYVGAGGQPDAVVDQLPATPSTGQTDIGSAISSALDELERPGAAPVGSIVLVTDGANNPPAGSAYPGVSGPPWQGLTARAGKLASAGRAIHGYALPLGADANGAELLRQVVPATTVVNTSGIADIAGFLDRTKRAIRVEKARQQLTGDIGRGIAVEWPADAVTDMGGGQASFDATLRSHLVKAPVHLTNLALAVSGGPADVATLGPTAPSIDLGPGQAVTVSIQVRWAADAGLFPYRRTLTLQPEVTLNGEVTSPWAAALLPDIALNVPGAPVDNAHALHLERTVGDARVLPAMAALLVLLLIAAAVYVYLLRNPRVTGTLRLERLLTSDTTSIQLRRGATAFSFPATSGGPPGRGIARPIRTAGGRPAVQITYSPDGSPGRNGTHTLAMTGAPLTVGSVIFTVDEENARGRERAGDPA